MHQVEHRATTCIRSRIRRSGELVAAPGDLEHRAMKCVMLEILLVLISFPFTNAQCILLVKIDITQ